MKPKIYVTRRLPEKAMKMLEAKFELDVWPDEIEPPKSAIVKGVKGKDGLLSLLTDTIDAEVMDAGGKGLKIIGQYAVGVNNIDLKAAGERGILVTNTPGVLTDTTADLAFTLLVSIARRIPECDKYVRGGRWKVGWGPNLMVGTDIHHKTIGIVGMGRIGYEVARRARGFCMEVVYSDEKKNEMAEKEFGAKMVSFDELLAKADFVSVHVPLTPETKHLINWETLNRMKKNAFLINSSRGPVVDQKALARALKEDVIAGAALDVFEKEPIENGDGLLACENAVLVPHIGSASRETREKMGVMTAENLIAYFEGRVPPNPVNPEVLEKNKPKKWG